MLELNSAHAQEKQSLPQITKDSLGNYRFQVNGRPYLVLGAQLWNSSAWPMITDQFWDQAKELLGCNTLEAPIYWQNLKPEPGKFNFEELDHLILSAREQGFRLVLLWFASYKNGRSEYAPPWVLEDTETYPRMRNASGEEIYVLSAIAAKNWEADKKAFVEVMRHIKAVDADEQTVLMMQVQDEPGSMWTDRDYSEAANRLFDGPVPEVLTKTLDKKPGTWKMVFGPDACRKPSMRTTLLPTSTSPKDRQRGL